MLRVFKQTIIKSNDRSEDSYIGLDEFFFSGEFIITTDVHSYILMHLWMHLGIYALFEFIWNSAESGVNSTLQIQTWK